ncbi:glycosyl hydrolase family 18 (putative chitinase) [Frondihabitans sp. PhB188]|uniref:glycosyl hydrolase family 18 protein n=1 Tax=Frondihabitans sp. PhB188 TaxID=2485200 RepID=UPI000F483FA6|nr:glycosyl hydrolase family 18 protein [Frondihabitans sp. PhB188]ROQ38413.1 glycosyl hydrolase family 18 (putative chitinase) [Frondihabitans sp. PhB188]
MLPTRSARLVTAALAALVVLTAGCSSAQAATPPQVVGYAEAGSTSTAKLDASRSALTTIGIDGVNVTSDGGSITPVSTEALDLVKAAHARSEKAELLVGNFDGDLGDFSPAIGDALLGSRTHIDAVVGDLAAEVRAHGWDGVTVDLESLSDAHAAGLTRFVSELNKALGAGTSVSVCIMASTGGYAALGYDMAPLGRAADHIVLMAYDEHGPGWSGAGAVGGLPWVKESLAPLRKAVPASKLQLGIAGYGYTWPKHGNGEQLSDARARAIVKRDRATAKWSAAQAEWHATLSSGTTIWWSDARSYRTRLAYAKHLKLGGVAVWSLGLSDALTR